MSAETYAHERYADAIGDTGFLARLNAVGGHSSDRVAVVDEETPIGEVLAQVRGRRVVAVCDDDAPHGFTLVRIEGEPR